ncbi:MAG: hypothetical protein OSB08_06960 [SAR324 cluster bacterium]|nr:hypothetical protein [SAR324 cluster bacterium]
MKRLLYEINAFEVFFGSALVENGTIHNGAKQEMFLEDETGSTTSMFVETFEKLYNQTVLARQVYGTRALRIYCSIPWFTKTFG